MVDPEQELLEARTASELRSAYAAAIVEHGLSPTPPLAGLRRAMLTRRTALERSVLLEAGLRVDTPSVAAWMSRCFDPSTDPAQLAVELDTHLAQPGLEDIDLRRKLLAARDEWFVAQEDPHIPARVLEALERRVLDVPTRETAKASKLRRSVGRRIALHYPTLAALAPEWIARLQTEPHVTGTAWKWGIVIVGVLWLLVKFATKFGRLLGWDTP